MTPAARSLLRAAADGDANLLRALLAQGTDVNTITTAGQTPLMLAASFGHQAVVLALLKAGADVERQDELGLTVFDWAAKTPNIVELIKNTQSEQQASDVSPVAVAPSPPAPTFRLPTAEVIKPRLGGLAGAILRDHGAKISNHVQPLEEVLELPPPEPEPAAFVTPNEEPESPPKLKARVADSFDAPNEVASPLCPEEDSFVSKPEPVAERSEEPRVSSGVSGVVPTPSAPSQLVEEVPVATTTSSARPAGNQSMQQAFAMKTAPAPPIQERIEKPAVAPTNIEADDDTLSRSLSDQDDTATRGGTVRRKIFDMQESYETQPPPVSKVEVPVKPPASTLRPILFVLFFFLVGAGGFAAYRFFSSYLLAPHLEQTPAPASQPQAQPTPVQAKHSPVVGGDLAGSELHLPDAEYPAKVAQGHSGNVTVQVQVTQKGRVISAKAIDGDESLRAAAERASTRAAFSPAKLAGKGRVIDGTITYSFFGPQAQASSTADSDVPVAGGPLAGAELKLVPAKYPSYAKRKGIGGTVTIVVRVNKTGRVISWRAVDGDSQLRSAATRAARQSTFAPEKLNAKDDVVGTITYTFRP